MKLHHPEVYQKHYGEKRRHAEKAFKSSTYFTGSLSRAILNVTPLGVYLLPFMHDTIRKIGNPTSFLLLRESPELLTAMRTMLVMAGGDDADTAHLQEEVTTSIRYAHSYAAWEMYGKRLYEVHPDLSWALQRTELQDFPTEELQLPCPTIYLELPQTLEIPNNETGNHPCMGAFLMEEKLDDIRIWRIMLIGGPSESVESQKYVETFGYDDAMFHYYINLDKPTVSECIESQLTNSIIQTKKIYHWEGKELESINNSYFADEEAYTVYKNILTETFRYIMNCVIYMTTAESDVLFCEASKEYRNLKARALKAQGEKRRKLFEKLRATTSYTRYIMGSKTIIDRKRTKEASVGEGRKLTKGSMVMGHWQRYWIGPKGEQTCIRKLRLPFWRGPVGDTLDTRRHVTRLK